jgi:hypothetical protein
MVLLLCDFIRSRGEQIDLMQPFALANSGCQHRGGHLQPPETLPDGGHGKPWLSVCLIFFIVPGLAPTYVEKAKFSLAGTDDLSRSCQEVLRGVNGRRFVENISPEFIRFLIDAYTVM